MINEAGAKMARSMESLRLGLGCRMSGSEAEDDWDTRWTDGDRRYLLSLLTGRPSVELPSAGRFCVLIRREEEEVESTCLLNNEETLSLVDRDRADLVLAGSAISRLE